MSPQSVVSSELPSSLRADSMNPRTFTILYGWLIA
jgi:hypothetical protein